MLLLQLFPKIHFQRPGQGCFTLTQVLVRVPVQIILTSEAQLTKVTWKTAIKNS